MRIAIDAMGGDHAPKSAVEGAVQAVKEYGVEICLVGIKDEIHKYLSDEDKNNNKIIVIEASEVISNHDTPVTAIKQKKDSSMVVGLKQVKEGSCDAFLSAGSTGAFLAGSLLKVGRIKGIDRPALSPLIPTTKGLCMIIDAGANLDCKPKNLQQFAVMGSIYMEKVMGIHNPRVGLLNVGTEEGKGTELTKQSYELLSRLNVNFIGNIEARDVAEGICDVCVCDGFAGNVLLKTTEGVAQVIFDILKGVFMQNAVTKVAALMLKKGLKDFKKKFDYKEVGGAPFMGIDGIMIKAHGSSDARAVKNAVRQAKLLYDNKCLEIIRQEISELEVDTVENAE
ncbi:MAG: plsX [Clostridia bacterium]|jgi:glycerol-3-phosphate acyltransferase PlsX|nr:plsX [Clostridia bacterium]